jgi:YD repeat-containing protein
MKIQYFPETDTLAIELTSKPVTATDAITDDLILDYDDQGKLVAITLDNCSKNVDSVNLQTLDLPLLSL